ncbi:MAG: response regulator [Qipengyuania sp.]
MNKLLSGRTILIVEDEIMVLLNMEAVIADLGCTSIITAASVDQALSLIDTHAFDIAVLDLNLDGEPSYPIADALAVLGVPFIFSTGYSTAALGGSYGNRPVLRKPYRDEELKEVLDCLLASPATPIVQ